MGASKLGADVSCLFEAPEPTYYTTTHYSRGRVSLLRQCQSTLQVNNMAQYHPAIITDSQQ